MTIFFLIFFLIALTILFGGSSFLAFSFIRFFSVRSISRKRMIFFGTACIPLIFIVASFLVSVENEWGRNFYTVSAVVLGTGTQLVFAASAVWVTLFVFRALSLPLSAKGLASFFFALALLVSAFGVWNSFHPALRRIDVSIPNLPLSWEGKRIVQLSDIHLGAVYGASFMRQVSETTKRLEPDLIVITGDLFDGVDGGIEKTIGAISSLHAPHGVFFVAGNHETYLGIEKTYALLKETGIRILDDEMVPIDGLRLLGIEYPDRGDEKDVADVARRIIASSSEEPLILLYHAPTHIEKFRSLGVNLQLSGHTHRGQMFPFNFITSMIYRGSGDVPLQRGNYTLFVSNGVGTWGPPMRTGNRPEIVEITLKSPKRQ